MHDHDDPRAEEALLAREQDMREDGTWDSRYRTRIHEPEETLSPEQSRAGWRIEDGMKVLSESNMLAAVGGRDLVLDTDENGEPRGTIPDPDRAAILAIVETLDRPMALLPAAEMALAALDRVVGVLRRDTTTTRALSEAHGAAELAGILFGRLREQLAAELERVAGRFPKECMACGAVCADTPEWQALAFVGVQVGDPKCPDLELRLCGCGSTIAMPRVGA